MLTCIRKYKFQRRSVWSTTAYSCSLWSTLSYLWWWPCRAQRHHHQHRLQSTRENAVNEKKAVVLAGSGYLSMASSLLPLLRLYYVERVHNCGYYVHICRYTVSYLKGFNNKKYKKTNIRMTFTSQPSKPCTNFLRFCKVIKPLKCLLMFHEFSLNTYSI